jgi:hypothetical protein
MERVQRKQQFVCGWMVISFDELFKIATSAIAETNRHVRSCHQKSVSITLRHLAAIVNYFEELKFSFWLCLLAGRHTVTEWMWRSAVHRLFVVFEIANKNNHILCTQYIVQLFSIKTIQTVALCGMFLHNTVDRLGAPLVPTVSCGLRFRVHMCFISKTITKSVVTNNFLFKNRIL